MHRFQQLVGSEREFYENLAHGQTPETLFITCSDSRINPNLITQTKPGELFILRNAGNIVPPHGAVRGGEAATIEYAIGALGVRDVIICGHSHCGAMHGLHDAAGLDQMRSVRKWLAFAETAKRIIDENYRHLKNGEVTPALVNATAQENALVQLEHCMTHPVVAARMARRELNLHAWFYKIETGEIHYYDKNEGQYLKLSEVTGDVSPATSLPGRRIRASAI